VTSGTDRVFDILVVGGGVNGCGIARDAAGRGFSVMLAEAEDLASGTSSWSTKLIHGGLRYLEHDEFRLVREALQERERLWANAPHIIWPLRFVLPHHKGLRPAWLLRLGLFLYDHIGGRKALPVTRKLDLRKDPLGAPLKDSFCLGFEYSDCAVDDARLVQGSHIVVKRLFDHDRCYIFQNADKRIVFAIPYKEGFTLIGTTDQDYEGDPRQVAITEREVAYLCDAVSGYLAKPVKPEDIVWTYSGVRPLFDDHAAKAQEATRDYVLKHDDGPEDGPRIVNVFGGKLTTYRRLAESVMRHIEEKLGTKQAPWTAKASLPGGDFPMTAFDDLVARLRGNYAFLDAEQAHRL